MKTKKTKAPKKHWTEIMLYDAQTDYEHNDSCIGAAYYVMRDEDVDEYSFQALSSIVRALCEYQRDGGIVGYWLSNPENCDSEGWHLDPDIDTRLEDGGPTPEEIDFSGLDEVYDALDEDDYEQARELVFSSRAHATPQSGRA
jgi:hypothetical protein